MKSFTEDWSPIENYRGQNSNMHLTEALMAAFEATGDKSYLTKAERIADLISAGRRRAGLPRAGALSTRTGCSTRIIAATKCFVPPAPRRPLAEWSRLLLQLWALGNRKHEWMPTAAKSTLRPVHGARLDREKGGFFYTLDWDNTPAKTEKLWWPMCEAAGAATSSTSTCRGRVLRRQLPRIWSTISNNFLDHQFGGWHEELTKSSFRPNTLPRQG